jgi:hypothetical protein
MKYLKYLVFLSAAAGACVEASSSLDAGPVDAGPVVLEYCEGVTSGYVDEQGEWVSVPVTCPRGAVCGETGGFYACYADGTFRSTGQRLLDHAQARLQAHNPDYPRCTHHDQCDPSPGSGACFYEPGCTEPSGICCPSNWCDGRTSGQPAHLDCSDGRCLTYCGCDGVTYEGLPTKPYAYPGPCR